MEGSEEIPERSSKPQQQSQCPVVADAESVMNLALLDPPRWGWTAVGSVADLLPPHERSRRRSAAVGYRKLKRKRIPSAVGSRSGKGDVPAPPAPPALSTSAVPSGDFLKVAPESSTFTVKDLSSLPLDQDSKPPATIPNATAKHDSSATTVDPVSTVSTENQQQQAVPDVATGSLPPLPTGKLLGFKRHLLGMDVKKLDLPKNSDNSIRKSGTSKKGGKTSSSSKRGRATYECRVNATSQDGVLDMYSYHRGREGYEPRNSETGELQCPLEATDTNCNYDAPRLCFNVTIEFPLHDGTVVDKGSTTTNDLPIYSETITWDLSDTSTPSPLVVATNIAQDFGLAYGQMLDLALSIQSQIDAHVLQNFSYWTPISVTDPAGVDREYVGSAIQTHRYGSVVPLAPGGTRFSLRERQRSIGTTTPGRNVSRASSSVNGSSATTSARRKKAPATTATTVAAAARVEMDDVDFEVEEKYIEEAKQNGRIASALEITKKCTNGEVGLMDRLTDGPCHVCRKRCSVVFAFACGYSSHSYCLVHCKARLGDSFNPENPIFSYCPICALTCICAKCDRKVRVIARGLRPAGSSKVDKPATSKIAFDQEVRPTTSIDGRKRKLEQITGVDAEEDTIPVSSRKISPLPNAQHPKRTNTVRTENRARLLVPKPPLNDFPREIYGTHELEPGTPEDYLRVYTSKGTYLSDDFPEVWSEQQDKSVDSDSVPTSSGEFVVEDGNVDACNVCGRHGNLLCCDFCPRAFHLDCLNVASTAASEDRWECIVCKKEKEGLPDHLIDTTKFVDLICASFADVKVADNNGSREIEALSAIYAMLSNLMVYDFGYMFAVPVDVHAVPGYNDIVKNPMDLDTICRKLASGGYADILKSGGTFDDVLVAVLQDTELVWHNCFLFNFDGSAVYRMAAVQRRRALAIQKKSFDHLLSDYVKSAVSDYVHSCEIMRGQFSSTLPLDISPATNAKQKELRSRKPKGKHKITVKVCKPSINRPIAIFDSVTGRIVKIYSSVRSAGNAVNSLMDSGHRCEWPPAQDLVKYIVAKSASDPSVLLFGYRWIMLDDLRAGKVSFHQPSFEGVQVRQGDNTYTYLSFDEAASCPLLDKIQSIEQFRQQLSNLERGCDWTSIGGNMWRRLASPGQGKPREVPPLRPGSKNALVVEEKTDDEPVLGGQFLVHSIVVKEDLLSRRKLVGFESIKAAFQDWKHTALFSPTFPPLEARTMDNFKKYYLDGERNIDCLVWRSQERSRIEPGSGESGAPLVPLLTINGFVPSPLVRSASKRSQEIKVMGVNNIEKGIVTKQNDNASCSVENPKKTPALVDGRGHSGTSLSGIQLFKPNSESDHGLIGQNSEGLRGPKDSTAAIAEDPCLV